MAALKIGYEEAFYHLTSRLGKSQIYRRCRYIMDFLNPGYLKSVKEFSSNFALPIEKYRNSERVETLKRLLQPFVLRRLNNR